MSHFEDMSLQPWFIASACGAVLIGFGILAFLIQLYVSFKRREKLVDESGDPWGGRTLEWSTSSPPPAYNFAFTPRVHELDAWHDMKSRGYQRPRTGFIDIHMPRNTSAGIILSGISAVLGFALIWHIWWLAGLALVGLIGTAIGHSFNDDRDYHIPAREVTGIEDARSQQLAALRA